MEKIKTPRPDYMDVITNDLFSLKTVSFGVAALITIALVVGSVGMLSQLVHPKIANAAVDTAPTCTTIELHSGGGTKTAGWTHTNPTIAPLNQALYSLGSYGSAHVTESVIPPWIDPTAAAHFTGTGAQWVSSSDSWPKGASTSEGVATENQWRLFKDTFTVPAGAASTSGTVWYTADNAAAVYLNGNAAPMASTNTATEDVFGATPVSLPSNFGTVYTKVFTPILGENTLNFVTRNWGTDSATNPTGLVYHASVSYCVPATLLGTLQAQDFGVVSYDSGLGIIKGYSAGFGLTDATFHHAQSVVVKLYDGATLLQTNTATAKVGHDITGSQISSPFDVSGSFDYVSDGYWVNLRESQYGQSVPATKVVATVTLENGKVVTAENTLLTGDPSTIYPVAPTGVQVTVNKFVQGVRATALNANNTDFPMTASWNATNLGGAGAGSYVLTETSQTVYQAQTSEMSFGSSYSTKEDVTGAFVGASCESEKPFALVGYTTGDTLALAMAGTPTTTMPAFTNLQTSKQVIVWNRNCALPEGQIGGDVTGPQGVLRVTSVDMVDTTATADGSFGSGWKYVFHITAPSTEQNLTMKFSDWLQTGGGGTIAVANNMRISSAQADNAGATILLTAANLYATPALHMTTDLDPVMAGRQVEVTVDVAVPNGTPVGAYTTNYGVQSGL
jgi:hypothetical protein